MKPVSHISQMGIDKANKTKFDYVIYTPRSLPWCKTLKFIKENNTWLSTLSSETKEFSHF
jgi:hypothetical protein